MSRAGSLFEIADEPLFEPGSIEADGDGERGWEDNYDDPPPSAATVPRLETNKTGAPLGDGRRSRMLMVVAAVGVAGVLGSHLTQVADTPAVAPRAAGTSPLQAPAVAPAAHLIPSRRREGSRPRPAVHTVTRARQAGPPASAALTAMPAPAPRPTPPPPPEPQGFQGEFF